MIANLRIATFLLLCVIAASCSRESTRGEPHREVIQGFSTTIYRVTDGEQQWREISISVDGSKTFRMPLFFTHQGAIVELSEDEARRLIDHWLKRRAEQVAAYGVLDPKTGLPSPFLPIEQISTGGP